jgi:DNA modification methylase
MNPADRPERWAIERLIPYARNARTHSDAQVAQIAASIREWGWTTPILVDEDGTVLAGHGRLAAARQLQMQEVPVVIASGWSDAKRRAYVIADNKLALNAGWDEQLLALELADLADDFDLNLVGFTADEIESLKPEKVMKGLTDEDAVPDAPEQPVTVLGDIWLLGKHRLMCGDSTDVSAVERLMCSAKAEMVFTDPPYGVNYEGGHFHSGSVNIVRKRKNLTGDNSAAMYTKSIPIIAQVCHGPCYTWFAETQALSLYDAVLQVGEIHATLIWHKTNAKYAAMYAQYKQRHEQCLYWKRKDATLRWCGPTNECTVWEIKRDASNDFHPTQKPVELAERAITNHSAEVILDLFGGSGSTLIACEKTNRNCRMMEIDAAYCDVIVERWQDFTGKQAIHAETGQPFPKAAEA